MCPNLCTKRQSKKQVVSLTERIRSLERKTRALLSDLSVYSKMPTIGDKTYSKSIELPETEVFRNLKNAKRFAMDIGMMFLFKKH